MYIRTDDIDKLYQSMLDKKLMIHPTEPRRGFNKCTDFVPDANILTTGIQKSQISHLKSPILIHSQQYFRHHHWNTINPQTRACTSCGLVENSCCFSFSISG